MPALLANFQAQANKSKKPITVSWDVLNSELEKTGSPALDFDSFTNLQNNGNNLISHYTNNGGFSNTGIVLNPIGTPPDMVDNQSVIDKEHNTVKRTAMHALHKSKK